MRQTRGSSTAKLGLLLLLPGIITAGCHKTAPPDATDAGAKSSSDTEAAPIVSVTTVRSGTIEKILTASGTLQPLRENQASLSAPVAGIVDSLPVRTGQSVAKGEIIAHLSTRLLQGQMEQARATIAQNAIQVQQAEANLLQQQGQTQSGIRQALSAVSGARAVLAGAQASLIGAEAALTNARQTLARTQTLFGDGLVAQKDVEAAQLAVRTAEAQLAAQRQAVAAQRETVKGQEQLVAAARAARIQDTVKGKDIKIAEQQLQSARAALSSAQTQAALYTLRAPIAGTVTAVGASIGESVDTTVKLVTIANLDPILLQIALPTDSVSAVKAGLPLQFTADSLSGKTFRGAIRSIGTQADPATSTIPATALITNSDHLLKSDLYARVQIVSARHTGATLVDRSALLQETTAEGTETSVLRLEKEDKVKKVIVKTGFINGNTIEIIGGVKPGDRVVTMGGYGLADGTAVSVEKAGKTL